MTKKKRNRQSNTKSGKNLILVYPQKRRKRLIKKSPMTFSKKNSRKNKPQVLKVAYSLKKIFMDSLIGKSRKLLKNKVFKLIIELAFNLVMTLLSPSISVLITVMIFFL